MKTWRGLCLEDHEIVDGSKRLELKRGKEYDLSHEKDGQRCVFSTYWVWVPSEWFGGIVPAFGHSAGEKHGAG